MISKSSCARKETVDIDMYLTSRNDNGRIMQSITTSGTSSRIRKWNQLSQFRWASAKIVPIRLKLATFRRWPNDSIKASVGPKHLHVQFCSLSNIPKLQLGARTVFSARSYGRFIEIESIPRRKKRHETIQGSNFLGGSFSIRRNCVRAPI